MALLLRTVLASTALLLLVVASDEAHAQDTSYGTDGFLGRLSKGTVEVDACAPPSDVEEKERTRRASDHYDRGLVLYEEGDYGGAVAEFVSSYCDQPHPSAFYNIGQSFERLLLYEKAVAYFERYIIETENEGANRKRAALRADVLKGLPAQIRVATVPDSAQITLRSDVGVTARGVANADKALLVRKGRYTMTVSLPGYAVIEQEVVAEIGQPYSFYFRLTPLKGTVRINASPANARIFLDDRLVGIGSYVETVPVGEYSVTVESSGREPEKRDIAVRANQNMELMVELAQPAQSGRTSLLVASTLGLGLAGGLTLNSVLDQLR